MSTLAKLLVNLGLDSGDFVKGLADSAKQTDGLAKSLLSIGTVAVAAGAAAGTALLGVGIVSLKAFGQFETGMSEVFTLLPDLSQSAMGAMTADVKDFSKEFGVLPEQTIPALYQALSAGVPKDNVFEFLEIAQKAAVGGVTELETAVDGITSVINAYGPSVLGATAASDMMFTTVKLGKTNFEQLSASLFNVIPTAASLGVSFGDVSAALASLTLQGTPTSVATTQIRSALVEASKGGTKLSEALIGLTGKSFPQLIAEGGNIGTIFDTLRKSMPDQQFKDLFGSVEALNAVLGITGPNAVNFASNLAAMKGSTGATDLAFQTMNQTLGASVNKLKAFGAVFLIDIGEKLAPAVALFTNALIDLLNSQAVTDVINNMGLAIENAVTWLTNGSTIAVPGLSTALAEIMPQLTAFGQTLSNVFSGEISMDQIVTQFSELRNTVVAAILDAIPGIITSLQSWSIAVLDWAATAMPPAAQAALTGLLGLADLIVANAPKIVEALASWVAALGQWVLDALPGLMSNLLELNGQVFAWIAANGPTIASKLASWAGSFALWVLEAIPQLIVKLGELLAQVVKWIIDNRVKIGTTIEAWGIAFGEWITTTAIPGIVEGLGTLWTKLTGWISEKATLISADDSVGKALWDGCIKGLKAQYDSVTTLLASQMAQAITALIKAAAASTGVGKEIIEGIKAGINGGWEGIKSFVAAKATELLNAAKSVLGIGSPSIIFANEVGTPIIEGIILGVTQSAGLLTAAIQTTMGMAVTGAQAVVNKIAGVLDKSQLPAKSTFLGQTMIDNIAKAFEKHTATTMPVVNIAAQSIIDNIANTWGKGDIAGKAKSIGGNAMNGIISGIEGKLGAAVSKAKDAAQKILDAMTAKLDIKSPSGEFARNVGIPIVMGIMQGMTDKLPTLLAFIGKTGRKILDETLGVMASMTRSSGIDVFKSLLDLEKLDPFQPLVDATEALTSAQQQARGVSENLLDLNEEIAVLQNTPLSAVGDHLKYNQQITALYAKQAILLGEQAQAQANLARLGKTQADAQAQSAQQQVMINQISDNARKQYEAAQQQALGMMQQDAKGALDFFNKRKAQIAELAQLEKEKALAGSDQQRADLDTQIRLTQAAQQAEQTQQAVQVYIGQQDQRAMGDVDIIKIIENALRNAGLSVDIRTRTA